MPKEILVKVDNPLPGQEIVLQTTQRTAIVSYNKELTRRRFRTPGTWVEPPPPPPPPPPADFPPFGSRPVAGRMDINGGTDVLIEGKTFRATAAGLAAIRLNGARRVIIRKCDFIDVPSAVYAYRTEDLVLEDCRYSNITGPAQPRTGANVANFIQTNESNIIVVRRNKGKGGDTEDIVSFFRSGTALAEDNHFEGTNWTSGSGSGIALGDYGGRGNIAQRNILVNVGQVAAFIAGGVGHKLLDNIAIGQARPKSNIAFYVWKQGDSGESRDHEVARNRARWLRADGVPNGFWDAGNSGPILGLPSNNWNDQSLDIERYRVVL